MFDNKNAIISKYFIQSYGSNSLIFFNISWNSDQYAIPTFESFGYVGINSQINLTMCTSNLVNLVRTIFWNIVSSNIVINSYFVK